MSRAPKKPPPPPPPPDRAATPRPFPVAAAPTRTLVLCPAAPPERRDGRSEHGRRAEAVGLAQAIDLHVVAAETVPLRTPRPATLFGSGRVQTVAALVAAEQIELVVVDAPLSAVQQRNLERAWSCKVIDRTGLILEIFGERARTREGRLQVELAALTYQRSRLVRSWTHLERQRGGFGFLGGPGESQIELDRRRIDDRITRIQRELEAVKRTRGLHRAARDRAAYPVIALVGYTNAGKSTLFNRLTGARVGARDQLFATLDPTMRLLTLPSGREAILSDTVGFVADLPTDLVAAFRATLEEVRTADLVLHVRDVAHPETAQQRADVLEVLRSLDLAELADEGRLLEFWNKLDLLPAEDRAQLRSAAERQSDAVCGSALRGEGIPQLLATLEGKLSGAAPVFALELDSADGARLAWLYRHGTVVERRDANGRTHLRVALSPEEHRRFQHDLPGDGSAGPAHENAPDER
jgi:GTP-binding protein HflX